MHFQIITFFKETLNFDYVIPIILSLNGTLLSKTLTYVWENKNGYFIKV